jgi:hypothetical protein
VIAEPTPSRTALRGLSHLLAPPQPPQLARLSSFSRLLPRPAALLGSDRIRDLIVNCVLPAYLAQCIQRGDRLGCDRARELLLAAGKLAANRRFEEAVHRFIVPPSRARDVVRTACAQQGLLYLYEDAGELLPGRACARQQID